MWIFGYGSLVWKVDFPYESKKPGYIRHFVRRFWQKSTDHRGTPDAPGLVVTLLPYHEWLTKYSQNDPHSHSEMDVCWGMAYKIADKDIEHVRAHLDFREKDGYETFETSIYSPESDAPIIEKAIIYVATTQNPNFHGPCSTGQLAVQIARSVGQSGSNSECMIRDRD